MRLRGRGHKRGSSGLRLMEGDLNFAIAFSEANLLFQARECSLLKKRALEGRLKNAALSFADVKTRADRALIRAKNFKLGAPAAFDLCAHRAASQLRRIAIAREMTEHHPLDFTGQQLLDDGRGGGVGEMTVPRHDALLYRPRPMRVALQK